VVDELTYWREMYYTSERCRNVDRAWANRQHRLRMQALHAHYADLELEVAALRAQVKAQPKFMALDTVKPVVIDQPDSPLPDFASMTDDQRMAWFRKNVTVKGRS
jgi:hypothetical protein